VGRVLFPFLTVAALAFFGYRLLQPGSVSAQVGSCFSAHEAGFNHASALSQAGDRSSLDMRITLLKAPMPLNFDAFVFVNGRLKRVEDNIAVTCDQPALRSVLLQLDPEDTVSVVYTRHILDKTTAASELVRRGDLSHLEPRLLADVDTVANGAVLSKWSIPTQIVPKSPDRPALSRVLPVGSPINEFGGIIRQTEQRQPVELLIYNDAKKTVTYNVVCLNNQEQLQFTDGKPLASLQLPTKKYATVQVVLNILTEGELGLIHCYSLYSHGSKASQSVEVSPIWPAFTLRGEIR
jgi:hypothetical protein